MLQSSLAHLLRFSLLGFLAFTPNLISASTAYAQNIIALPAPEEPTAAVNNFKLTEEFLAKMETIQPQLLSLDVTPTPEETRIVDPSIASMIASLESRPAVVKILEKEGITARDYILGYMALLNSLGAAEGADEETMIDETKNINPEHVAFGKKYAERIRNMIGD